MCLGFHYQTVNTKTKQETQGCFRGQGAPTPTTFSQPLDQGFPFRGGGAHSLLLLGQLNSPRNCGLLSCLQLPIWWNIFTHAMLEDVFKYSSCLQITMKYTILFNPIVTMKLQLFSSMSANNVKILQLVMIFYIFSFLEARASIVYMQTNISELRFLKKLFHIRLKYLSICVLTGLAKTELFSMFQQD